MKAIVTQFTKNNKYHKPDVNHILSLTVINLNYADQMKAGYISA